MCTNYFKIYLSKNILHLQKENYGKNCDNSKHETKSTLLLRENFDVIENILLILMDINSKLL